MDLRGLSLKWQVGLVLSCLLMSDCCWTCYCWIPLFFIPPSPPFVPFQNSLKEVPLHQAWADRLWKENRGASGRRTHQQVQLRFPLQCYAHSRDPEELPWCELQSQTFPADSTCAQLEQPGKAMVTCPDGPCLHSPSDRRIRRSGTWPLTQCCLWSSWSSSADTTVVYSGSVGAVGQQLSLCELRSDFGGSLLHRNVLTQASLSHVNHYRL